MTDAGANLNKTPKPGGINDDPPGADERDLLLFKSKLCEQAGRFEDMVQAMNEICQKYDDLSDDEKNLLSCAYKNVIGSRRTSWRILSEHLSTIKTPRHQRATNDNKDKQLLGQNNNEETGPESNGKIRSDSELTKSDDAIISQVLENIEFELREHCGNIIDILTSRLIPSSSTTGESRVFYHKMKGDYLRYLCEISPLEERREKSNESLLAYKTACDKATIELPPTHPVRLGLMLNFSVFYYDILNSPERSCRLAKQAFDDAIAELDTLSEESYRDSTIIMQLLRDNLTLWESEQNHQQPGSVSAKHIVAPTSEQQIPIQ